MVQIAKQFVVSATGLSKDTLHVYTGLAVMFIAALVLRKPIRSFVPWLIVLAVAAAGESLDMRDDFVYLGYWRWQSSLHDITNTMFWPSIMLMLSRFRIVLDASVEHGTR